MLQYLCTNLEREEMLLALHYISENLRMRDEIPGIQETPKNEKQNQTNKKKTEISK